MGESSDLLGGGHGIDVASVSIRDVLQRTISSCLTRVATILWYVWSTTFVQFSEACQNPTATHARILGPRRHGQAQLGPDAGSSGKSVASRAGNKQRAR